MILTMPLILADYHMVTIKIQRDVELEMAGENHKRNWSKSVYSVNKKYRAVEGILKGVLASTALKD